MDDGIEGVDAGDLDEQLDRIAAAHADPDDDLHIRPVTDAPFCQHAKAAIDGANRSLTCRACGAPLDPFDFLHRLSNSAQAYVATRKQAEHRAREATARLDQLLRQERNARRRLNNLNRKQP